MRSQSRVLFAFALSLSIVMSACTNEITMPATPTAAIAAIPTSTPQPVDMPTPTSDGSGIITFVDKNNLLAFDLPGNWTHEDGPSQRVYYSDIFISPDGSARIGSSIYNDGEPFDPSKNKEFALYLLNTYYSSSGKAGEIKIVTYQMLDNGLERFDWAAEDGSYSGVSLFELRGDDLTTFLMFTAKMFTAKWTSATGPATLDVINAAIASFRIP